MARRGVKRGGKRGGRSLTFLTPGRKSIDVGWGSRVGLRNAWKGGNVAGRVFTNNQAYFLNKATRTFLSFKQIAPSRTWSTGESHTTHSFLGQFHNAPVGLGSIKQHPYGKPPGATHISSGGDLTCSLPLSACGTSCIGGDCPPALVFCPAAVKKHNSKKRPQNIVRSKEKRCRRPIALFLKVERKKV